MGFPGCGKTRFLLSLIKQHIDNDEGCMVLDSHRDLALLVLSHVPPEKWDRVIYINPWSAFEDKYDNRVVQINFLECKDPRDRDVIARMFMDTLEKIYERWWGPRLDMILLNALYLLMEKESAKLPDLYKILADKEFREMLLAKCQDNNVKLFWEQQYEKMPKDASVAVLTKIYRLVQERIIIPMFMAEKSCVDFRKAMDQRKILIIDLPEGKVTTDIANFVGSLILSRIYIAGMSREDTPEEERPPFFVYIDEAYRYTTKSIPETLQSLRKFKVFMTLASQYLEQYRKDIQEAIPQTCETVISFRVGEDTAKTLEKFFPKEFGYQTLMSLPRHLFFVSTPFCGNREYQVLETLDYGTGPSEPDAVIRKSLERYGRHINIEDILGEVKKKSNQREFLDWPVTPAEWTVLLQIRWSGGQMDQETILKQLVFDQCKAKPNALTDAWVLNALKNLAVDTVKRNAWLAFKDETVRQWREEAYAYGKREVKAQEERTRTWRLILDDKTAKRFLEPQFKGDKAGDAKHIQAIIAQRKTYWLNGWITRVDTGETDESVADLYVTPTLPAPDVEGAKGYIDPQHWDYERSFAVEVESYPEKHWDRVKSNYERNKKMHFPTVFVVFSEELEAAMKKKLEDWGATVVANSVGFEPGHPEMAAVDVVKTQGGPTEKSAETQQACEKASNERSEREQKQPVESEQTQGKELVVENQDEPKGEVGAPQSEVDAGHKETEENFREQVEDERPPAEKQKTSIEKSKAAGIERISEKDKAEALLELLTTLKGFELITRDNDGKTQLIGLKTVRGKTIEINLGGSNEFAEAVKTLSAKLEKAPEVTPQQAEKPIERPLVGSSLDNKIETTPPLIEKTEGNRIEQTKAEVDRESLIHELAHLSWWFTLRKSGEKNYLYARMGKNEARSLGAFDDEAKRIIEKFGLKVKGFNE